MLYSLLKVVGDGIADFLAVEVLLRYYGWSVADWERHTYLDAPSCQLKIPVSCLLRLLQLNVDSCLVQC